MINMLLTEESLDLAYDWLCRQRKNAHHNHDVWDLRWHWEELKPTLLVQLTAGTYRLSPTRLVLFEGKWIEVWSSQDSLVLKAVSIVLSREWHGVLSDRCFHLAGRGGAKAAVREVADQLKPVARAVDQTPPKFVFRTDVKSYYASIDHDVLMEQIGDLIDNPVILNLVDQYARRTVYNGGLYLDVERGIPLGCSLSPLIGAVYLRRIDEAMEASGLFYARFMDDWVILAPTRWKLRKAVRLVNETLAKLRVEQHPDKTFIGRIGKGFDFLGYEITTGGIVGIAQRTLDGFVKRVTQLYEQGATACRIGDYIRRWLRWVRSGWGKLVAIRISSAFANPRRPSQPNKNLETY
jgi:hypothetical protein